ncbi:hypothetical protein GGR57DRAFT_85583 [Xylariaceae sp. FL1272]|nr:hypothetical protein GGR57DRAFT_85583 [Xylariaceae sp. FL1272]
MTRRLNALLLAGAPLFLAQRTAAAVPCLDVPSCDNGRGTVQYDKTVPNGENEFPTTQVDLCYTDSTIEITFTAFDEVNFFYNASQVINDPIYEYEVMEAFIYKGTSDPTTYFEFEVSPNNITWQAFVYNPSKVRTTGAPFDNGQLHNPIEDGLVTTTSLDKDAGIWVSNASLPLALFNVDNGQAEGTKWRMNFFRTVVAEATFPDQLLGAWSPTNESSFHMTPFFGDVTFT